MPILVKYLGMQVRGIQGKNNFRMKLYIRLRRNLQKWKGKSLTSAGKEYA